MVKNIDNIAMRGERLELLVNKTENLSANVCKNILTINIINHLNVIMRFNCLFQSVTFRKTSRNLARSLFWKNVKIYVIVGAILIVSSILWSYFRVSNFYCNLMSIFCNAGCNICDCLYNVRRIGLAKMCGELIIIYVRYSVQMLIDVWTEEKCAKI